MTTQFHRKPSLVFSAALVLAAALVPATGAPKTEPVKDQRSAAPDSRGATVLATIGDQKITEDDLLASVPADRQQAFAGASQKIQEIERTAMEEVFAKRYVAEQAKA